MKHIQKLTALALCAAAALSLKVPALAADYDFETAAPQDYYDSTSYEDVYGSPYNYGGPNVVDYQAPELEYGLVSTTQHGAMERVVTPNDQVYSNNGGGSGEYGIAYTDRGSGEVGDLAPELLPDSGPTAQKTVLTSAAGMTRSDGTIGTVSIPSLGLTIPVWEGETTQNMLKGLGHYASTSAWDGNVGVCGHNRGAKYVIGAIKDLHQGDTITYTTAYGTRTYQVTMVQVISNTDWSYLQPTADNRITLTTCLANEPDVRVCVQAVEK